MVYVEPGQIWMLIVGFLISFFLAFFTGANDVANSFGTSVGAKVLTLRQACILGSIFETLGAVLLGAKVSSTIQSDIVDVSLYQNTTETLMVGSIAALSGSCIWMLGTTLLRLPISGTHTIVGALVGFALVTQGSKGVHWAQVGKIVGCWFLSPLVSGMLSVFVFFLCKYLIFSKEDPLEPGLRLLPILYACTIAINLFSVFFDGPKLLKFDQIPLWGVFIISCGGGLISAIVVKFAVVPWQRRRIQEQCSRDEQNSSDAVSILNEEDSFHRNTIIVEMSDESQSPSSKNVQVFPKNSDKCCKEGSKSQNIQELQELNGIFLKKKRSRLKRNYKLQHDKYSERLINEEGRRNLVKDRPETVQLFSFIQILAAVFGAFTHGGNDVSNGIAPLVSMWIIATKSPLRSDTPLWMLLYGGVGISIGLWIWGRRLIKTIGEDLTKVTPSSGFSIELGSSLTALVANNASLPISTTQCKVASVVAVGRFRTKENVDWSIFRNIVLAWLITFPVTGGVTAALVTALIKTIDVNR